MQRRGYSQVLERTAQHVLASRVDEQAGLEHRLGEFLHEQRYAVSLVDYLRKQGLGQGLRRDVSREHRALPPRKPVEGMPRQVRVRAPSRLEIRPMRNQHEHPRAGELRHQKIKQFVRCGVDPVHVLANQQQRLALGGAQKLAGDRFERALLLSLR